MQDRVNIHASVIRLGQAISGFLLFSGFTRSGCSFALKTRHQKEGNGYRKLSWHVTLLAFAPYSEWRQAMLHTERMGYSVEIKKLLRHKQAYLAGSSAIPDGVNMQALLAGNPWIAALLADSHILANSKGQYLQTLCSEKVDPATPATGLFP